MSNTDLVTQRDALSTQLESLNLKADIAQLETTLRHHNLAENEIDLREAWGDFIDPLESYRAEPEFFGNPSGGHVSRADDRKDGDNAPIFNTEQNLAFIRGAGEFISQSDSTAIGALETLASYVIGKGFVWEAKSEESPDAAMIVQRILDEFIERVDWTGGLDRELFKRTRRSGESFIRIHRHNSGLSDVEVYEPSWIMAPNNEAHVADHYGLPDVNWKYGIATQPGRASQVFGYSVFRHGDPSDFEFVPAELMSHTKINVDRNVKRGLTDFYANEEWLSGAGQLLRRTLSGGAIQASIALIREWNPKASQTSIDSAASGLVQYQSKLPNPTGGSPGYDNVPTEKYYPGKIVDVKGGAYKPGPMGSSNAPTYISIVQAGLRKAANRWSMPEFMISGDASNATYSSTLVSEHPFVKFCEFLQVQQIRDDSSIFWRVVKHAADQGRTRGFSFRELKAIVDLLAAVPDVATRDRMKEHTLRKEQNQAGILSRKGWSAQEDIDYETEQKQIELEPAVDPTAGPAGQAALGAALESVSTSSEARAILEDMR